MRSSSASSETSSITSAEQDPGKKPFFLHGSPATPAGLNQLLQKTTSKDPVRSLFGAAHPKTAVPAHSLAAGAAAGAALNRGNAMAAAGEDEEEGSQEDGYRAECRELQKNPMANGFRLINQVVNMTSSSDEEGPMSSLRNGHGLPPKPTRAPPPPPLDNDNDPEGIGGRITNPNNIRGT